MSTMEELVDWIDVDGNTIRPVTRQEILQGRLLHRCAYILVFNAQGELFIHQRTPTKRVNPSFWDVTVGGVLGAGEAYDQGAIRELEEELGIKATLESLFPFRWPEDSPWVHGMAYRVVHDGPFRLQVEEIVTGEFVGWEDLEKRLGIHHFCPDGLEVWKRYLLRKI